MISILLNNEVQIIVPPLSLQDLLQKNNHVESHFAVALNNQLVPRGAYRTTLLQADDRIDIIVPMQGG